MAVSKRELLAELRRADVARVQADYSGYGDEGFINYAELYDAAGEVRYRGGDERSLSPHDQSIVEQLYEFIDEELQNHSPGWENNEGGAGSVDINVTTGTIRFDHGLYMEPELSPAPFEV